MISRKIIAVLFFISILNGANAQEVKFGKISMEDLEAKAYDIDSTAPAAVLYRKVSIRYNYIQSSGFHIVTSVHERIKIYDKSGFDYATVKERLYNGKGDEERLSNLKAVTYNLENGEIVKNKLKNSETFSKELNKYYNEESFTMPNVKEGSIIEYQYKIDSPYSYSIDEIVLQYDIPIKKQEISIEIPEYYHFSPKIKGYIAVNPKYGLRNGKINFTSKTRTSGSVTRTNFDTNSMDYEIRTTDYLMNDVPALVEEPYVNDMDNYRSAVNYELQWVQYPQSLREDFTSTWEKVIETIYKSEYFGKQLEYDRYFKDHLPGVLSESNSQKEKAHAIFRNVQKRMNWNGYLGYYVDKGVKEAFEERSGNTADINLMLIAMLKKAGIKAYPMLLSTRDHGIPLFPTREGFNYVVAAAEIDGAFVFFDASNKFTRPNLLPIRALNWQGKIIREDGTFTTIDVFPNRLSKEAQMMEVSLNTDGSIAGKTRKSFTDYRAYNFRNNYAQVSEEDYLEKYENKLGGIEIDDYQIQNKNTLGKAISEEFTFRMEGQTEIVGDKIYFSPLFFHTMAENPFKLEDRKFPIDFAYPWRENYLLVIKIPQGYEVAFLPEDISLALPEDQGSFTYRIAQKGNVIQVMADLKIKNAVIPAHSYAGVKELFRKIVEKESEKVVLSKITENEHTESPAGGR